MKHIAHVLIENFQSHVRSELDFSSGLNVIIGPSDNGKSAVLRAVRWALYNEPRGSEFVRSGARECRVTVTMSDGAKVTRELTLTKSGGTGRNRYLVQHPGEDEQLFEGFGTEVPVEVIKAHGMPQVLLDSDKKVVLSFGSQLEGPFLMAESGSFRARAIGRLLGVHVVDAATRDTQKDLRNVRQEVARFERDLERYDLELQAYDDIPDLEERINRAEGLMAAAEAAQEKLVRMERALLTLQQIEREEIHLGATLSRLGDIAQAEDGLRKAQEVHTQAARLERLKAEQDRVAFDQATAERRLAALSQIPRAEERVKQAADLTARLTALARLEAEYRRQQGDTQAAQRQLDRLAQVPTAAQKVQAVEGLLQRLSQLEGRLEPLRELQGRLEKGRQLMTETESDLRGALGEYEQVLRQLGQCPTCMQPVAPASISRIMAELAGR